MFVFELLLIYSLMNKKKQKTGGEKSFPAGYGFALNVKPPNGCFPNRFIDDLKRLADLNI